MTDQDQENVLEALKQLDPGDDSHWTKDGDPVLELVKSLSGAEKLSRQELTNLAQVKRDTFAAWLGGAKPEDNAPPQEDEAPEHVRAALDRAIEVADELVAQAERDMRDARVRYEEKMRSADDLRNRRSELFPGKSAMEVMKEHLNRQHEERMARVTGGAAVAPSILDQSLKIRHKHARDPGKPVGNMGATTS